MAMVTTCPHCSTSFNVDPQVLLSRNGRVRCGKCKEIFDGLLAATTLGEFQAAAGMAPGAVDATAGSAEAPEPYWPALPEAPEVPIPPMPLEIAAAASAAYFPESTPTDVPGAEARDAVASASSPQAAGAAYAEDRVEVRRDWRDGSYTSDDSDDSEDAATQEPPRARWPWAVAATLAALLLAGQAAYRYRSELAAHYPVTKPALSHACLWIGCSVPALQQPASLNIEASDLQVVDKSRPHLVQLTATLRNRAAIDVGYPAFDLVLTDNRDHTLARRVIVPADYLTGSLNGNQTGAPALAAIAANAEITVRVDMDIAGLPAAGFRLNLAPAPVQ